MRAAYWCRQRFEDGGFGWENTLDRLDSRRRRGRSGPSDGDCHHVISLVESSSQLFRPSDVVIMTKNTNSRFWIADTILVL